MAVLLTYWHPQRLILLVLVPSAEAPRPPRHRAGRKYRRRLERLERRICAEVCAELLAQPNVPVSQEPGRRPAGEPKLHRRSSPPARHLPGPVPLSTPPPPPLQPHQGPSRTPWQLVPWTSSSLSTTRSGRPYGVIRTTPEDVPPQRPSRGSTTRTSRRRTTGDP